MTRTTTEEQALAVLQQLTKEHGTAPYFLAADVVLSDGFFGVDMRVDGEKWRARVPQGSIPPQINRVPVCVLVYG